ncbi:MAG: methyltransferase domain-containing protein [Nocardioidaceae bacterium]
MTDDTFADHQQAWEHYAATPWARIRYAVVRETLARACASLGPAPLRVLDVGGGDGLDALPLAEAGHDVTILDPTRSWLDKAESEADRRGVAIRAVDGGLEEAPGLGRFDLVLCHFVLQYRPADAPDLERLAGAVRSGGLLSLIAPNPAAAVLRNLVMQGPAEALAELGRTTTRTVTFDSEVRKIDPADAARALADVGCTVVHRYGGRIANDLLTDDAAKSDPDFYADLERLELALCDREPFNSIGAFWQLVARAD